MDLLGDERPTAWVEQGWRHTVGDAALAVLAGLWQIDPRRLAGRDPTASWSRAERQSTAHAVQAWWQVQRSASPGERLATVAADLPPTMLARALAAVAPADRGSVARLLAERWQLPPFAPDTSLPHGLHDQIRSLAEIIARLDEDPGFRRTVDGWPAHQPFTTLVALWQARHGRPGLLDQLIARGSGTVSGALLADGLPTSTSLTAATGWYAGRYSPWEIRNHQERYSQSPKHWFETVTTMGPWWNLPVITGGTDPARIQALSTAWRAPLVQAVMPSQQQLFRGVEVMDPERSGRRPQPNLAVLFGLRALAGVEDAGPYAALLEPGSRAKTCLLALAAVALEDQRELPLGFITDLEEQKTLQWPRLAADGSSAGGHLGWHATMIQHSIGSGERVDESARRLLWGKTSPLNHLVDPDLLDRPDGTAEQRVALRQEIRQRVLRELAVQAQALGWTLPPEFRPAPAAAPVPDHAPAGF